MNVTSLRGVLCLILTLTGLLSRAGAGDVTIERGESRLTIAIDGRELSQFHFAASQPKPWMWPVRAADGTILTRPIAASSRDGDHPHHKGIWVAIDEVGGVKFWAEQGRIVNRSVDVLADRADPAQFRVVNDWTHPDGHVTVTETTTVSVFSSRLLAYDIRFTNPGPAAVPFEDTKEGLFGFRMVDSMREKQGGRVRNADGLKTTRDCWGRPSAWVDYEGEVDGKSFGVTIMDHPLNFRASRYHVRDYGLFSVSPFGERAYTNAARPAEHDLLQPGSEFRLRYALLIHAAPASADSIEAAYRQYLTASPQ